MNHFCHLENSFLRSSAVKSYLGNDLNLFDCKWQQSLLYIENSAPGKPVDGFPAPLQLVQMK